tara:strand:- start:1089 stop:2045 length:957 start_codon:yes stop_codon:yes gene_type:complete
MGPDLSRTVTFVPFAYLLLKLSWTLVLIRLSFETSTGNEFKLTLRSDSRIAECLLILTALHEAGLDKWVFSKTEIPASSVTKSSSPGIVTSDLFVVFYILYFYRETARQCKTQSTYDFIAMVLWVLFSLLLFVQEMLHASNPDRIHRTVDSAVGFISVIIVSCCISILFSDACLLVNLSQVSFQDLCLRALSYVILVSSRCYLSTNATKPIWLKSMCNLMFFSHIFILKGIMAGVVFLAFVCVHAIVFLKPVPGEPSNPVGGNVFGAPQQGDLKTPPPLDPMLMEKLREMEAGMVQVSETRRRTSNLFAPSSGCLARM